MSTFAAFQCSRLFLGFNDIVQVLAPFIGNANAKTNEYYFSPIQFAIIRENTESIKLLAPFCDDYSYGTRSRTLIHMAVIKRNAEAIKILAPFMKTPNAPDDDGETPIQMATRLFGPNHDIVQILQRFQ